MLLGESHALFDSVKESNDSFAESSSDPLLDSSRSIDWSSYRHSKGVEQRLILRRESNDSLVSFSVSDGAS